MKPILFSENSTTFTTNGIGRLSDTFECIVTEERNGIYELEMTYPMEGVHYSNIGIRSIIVAKPSANANPEPFRVYKLSKPINGKVKIYAQHISYDLSKNTTMPFTVAASGTACNTALQGLKSNAVETCPFTFWTDVTTVASYNQKIPASIKQRLGGIEGSVLDQFGGEYEYVGLTVKLWRNRGSQRDITLRYGKNITDLEQEENIANTVTGVVPYWTDIDNTSVVTLTEKAVYSSHASQYSNKLTVPLDLSQEWENAPTEAQLRAAATIYVNKDGFGIPTVSTKVNFVNLADTEEYKDILPLQNVNLCDTIKVQFEKLGINTTAKIVKTVYNVLSEKYNSIEVGSLRSNLASTITNIEKNGMQAIEASGKRIFAEANSEAQDIINNATAWLTSADGYVVAIKDTNGEWKELLFMDHNDPEQAINVLRINNNGIGFSQSGVGGPYVSAWTIDGNFNADFITTGILKGATGENYWNMVTGEFRLASTSQLKITDAKYTGVVVPTNSNYPASSWSTDTDKANHVGELYYDTQHKQAYKYTKRGSAVVLTFGDQCVTESGYDYVKIYYQKNGTWYESSKFDGGRNGSTNNIAGKRVYIPTTEFYFYFYSDSSVVAWGYNVASVEYVDSNPTGVNYFTAVSSDPRPSISWTTITMGSSTLPESQHDYPNNSSDGFEFVPLSSDTYFWSPYNPTIGSYVTDEMQMVDDYLDQEEVFNLLTNNGQTQGIYLQNGRVYLNAEYMGAGALKIGGTGHTAIPSITVQDSSNNIIFQASASGMIWNAANSSMTANGTLTASNATLTGGTLNLGGSNDGQIQMKDSSNRLRGEWTKSAFKIYNTSGTAVLDASGGNVSMRGSLNTGNFSVDGNYIKYNNNTFIDMAGNSNEIHLNAPSVVFSVDSLGVTQSRGSTPIYTGYSGNIISGISTSTLSGICCNLHMDSGGAGWDVVSIEYASGHSSRTVTHGLVT